METTDLPNQASRLAHLYADERRSPRASGLDRRTVARSVMVCSGKGGVGKTNLSLNLALALAMKQRPVLLLDGDLGLANVNLLLGLRVEHTLESFLARECPLREAVYRVDGCPHLRVLPTSTGVDGIPQLSRSALLRLFKACRALEKTFDYLIIDAAAGIADNVLRFATAADDVLLVATPEVTSMMDAYTMIRVLYAKYRRRRFHLVLNMVQEAQAAESVWRDLRSYSQKVHRQIDLRLLGQIPLAAAMQEAVQQRRPHLLTTTQDDLARRLLNLAARLDGEEAAWNERFAAIVPSGGKATVARRPSFGRRLASWLRPRASSPSSVLSSSSPQP